MIFRAARQFRAVVRNLILIRNRPPRVKLASNLIRMASRPLPTASQPVETTAFPPLAKMATIKAPASTSVREVNVAAAPPSPTDSARATCPRNSVTPRHPPPQATLAPAPPLSDHVPEAASLQ